MFNYICNFFILQGYYSVSFDNRGKVFDLGFILVGDQYFTADRTCELEVHPILQALRVEDMLLVDKESMSTC